MEAVSGRNAVGSLASGSVSSSNPTQSELVNLSGDIGSQQASDKTTQSEGVNFGNAAFWNMWESYGNSAGLSKEQIRHAIETFLVHSNNDLYGSLNAEEYLYATSKLHKFIPSHF